MKNAQVFAIMILILPIFANAQWLETTITVGSEPVALVYNPIENKIYCANEHSDDVTVIDGASNSVIATIAGYDWDGPHALICNTTNNKVYCANRYSDDIGIIDGASNTFQGNIAVGYDPIAMTYNSANNKIYCANVSSADITVIDGNTNNVITTIAIGGYPHSLIYNPLENKIYCADNGSTVFVIDGATDTVITTIFLDPGDGAGSLGINETNNKIYCGVCAYHHMGTHVIDGEGDTTITYLGNVLNFDVTHNPVNNQIYVIDARAMVNVIDGVTDSIIDTVYTDDGSGASICNQTNNKVYVANGSANNVTIIDGESNTVCATIDVGDLPCALAWNPVQNRIYVANFGGSSVSVIRDSVVGIEDDKAIPVSDQAIGATIFRGPLQLPEGKNCKVFDITGRMLEPTETQPGIYFIVIDGVVAQKVVKIR